jgi:hypothetical protein
MISAMQLCQRSIFAYVQTCSLLYFVLIHEKKNIFESIDVEMDILGLLSIVNLI